MFNLTTVVGLLLLAVTIYFVVTDKVYVPIIYIFASIIAAFALGFKMPEIIEMFSGGVTKTMAGLLLTLAFVMPLFRMFAECGMFDVIGYHMIKVTKGNATAIYISTYLLALVAYLSGSLSSAYIVAFGAFLPVYKQLGLDAKKLLFFSGMATATLSTLPWNSVLMMFCNPVEGDPMTVFARSIPLIIITFICVCAVAVWFGIKDKDKSAGINLSEIVHPKDRTDKPLYRLKMLPVNLILFVAIFVTTIVFRSIPQWVVFMAGLVLMSLINYRSTAVCRKIFTQTAPIHFNLLIIFLGLSVFSGIMTGTGIIKNFVDLVVAVFPAALAKNMHIILAILALPICQYVPYQAFIAMMPFLGGVAAQFGIAPEMVALPFVAVLCFSTCCSPVVSTTYLGCDLAECDLKSFQKMTFPIGLAIGVLVLVLSWVVGWLA